MDVHPDFAYLERLGMKKEEYFSYLKDLRVVGMKDGFVYPISMSPEELLDSAKKVKSELEKLYNGIPEGLSYEFTKKVARCESKINEIMDKVDITFEDILLSLAGAYYAAREQIVVSESERDLSKLLNAYDNPYSEKLSKLSEEELYSLFENKRKSEIFGNLKALSTFLDEEEPQIIDYEGKKVIYTYVSNILASKYLSAENLSEEEIREFAGSYADKLIEIRNSLINLVKEDKDFKLWYITTQVKDGLFGNILGGEKDGIIVLRSPSDETILHEKLHYLGRKSSSKYLKLFADGNRDVREFFTQLATYLLGDLEWAKERNETRTPYGLAAYLAKNARNKEDLLNLFFTLADEYIKKGSLDFSSLKNVAVN